MSVINTNAKEIHCKVMYCGAKGVGKKSTLKAIKSLCDPQRVKEIELPFKNTVYGLVIDLGKIFTYKTFFHVYTLNYESKQDNETLLSGSDGVVFIASLDPKDRQTNTLAFLEMEELLLKQGKNLFKTPMVLQYNKSDLTLTQSLKQMRLDFNKYNCKDFNSSSLTGDLVLEPLKHVFKLALSQIKQL